MKNTLYIFSLFILLGCSSAKTESSHFIFRDKKAEQKYIKAYDASLKLWPVPFEERDIKTSYGTAHVIISGPAKGEPLVLLHGMDVSSTMWYPNVKAWSKNYRVYAIDYLTEPGKSVFNGEDKPDKAGIITWYNEIFDALNIKDINLVGTSRGGWLATHYTINAKGRVKKLALLSPAQTFENISMAPTMRKAANFKLFPNRNRLDKLVRTFSTHPEKISPVFREQMYYGTKYTKTSLDMLQMATFSDEELMTLNLPVMVLVGDKDVICSTDMLKIASEKLPDINASLIEDAGHFLTLDQQEIIDKKVLEFLSEK